MKKITKNETFFQILPWLLHPGLSTFTPTLSLFSPIEGHTVTFTQKLQLRQERNGALHNVYMATETIIRGLGNGDDEDNNV